MRRLKPVISQSQRKKKEGINGVYVCVSWYMDLCVWRRWVYVRMCGHALCIWNLWKRFLAQNNNTLVAHKCHKASDDGLCLFNILQRNKQTMTTRFSILWFYNFAGLLFISFLFLLASKREILLPYSASLVRSFGAPFDIRSSASV